MTKGSTQFLKITISLLGLAVVALCIFVLPDGIRHTSSWYGYRPLLIGMYIPAIPFFLALLHGFKLLQAIDSNNIFAPSSLNSLRIIKYCGIIIGSLYAISLPYIFYLAQMDDAPGIALIGLVFTFAPLGITLIAAIIHRQLQKIILLKSENDLTV